MNKKIIYFLRKIRAFPDQMVKNLIDLLCLIFYNACQLMEAHMVLLSKQDYRKVSGGSVKTDIFMYTLGTAGLTLEAVAASALVGYFVQENSAYANVSKSSFLVGAVALSTVAYSELTGYSHLGDLYDTYKKVKQVQNFFNFWG